ncbi:MAG: ATP-binding protein, partial [Candidatus Heimdallarchaeaceae archaeon]
TEKSELIEKLKISEKKYRTLFDNSVNPIYIIKLNKDGSLANILDVNHAAYQRLGLTKEEILQKPNNDLFSNASLDLSTLLSKLKKEGYVKFETQINMKDGETVYAEVQATKITLGEEDYVFVTLHDITDRIETFNLLQESERNLKTINKKLEETVQYRTKQIEKMYEFIKNISQLSDINEIMRIIAEYINKFVNFDIFIQIFIGEQINRILIKTPKNNDKLVDELVERTKEKLVDHSTEFMKNKDEITVISSEERIINQISSFTTLPLIVKNNKVIGIFALASEKKEQYEREDLWILNEVANYIASLILKLQVFISARNQLELVFNQATDGMILLNKNKTIVMNNKQNSEMMKFLVDTKNKQIKSEVLDLNNLISTGTKEIENNGTIYIIDVTEIKEKDFITGWLLTIRDVTKEREMQRKIVQHERLATIGRLTGGIAHDFNNILASIIGAADFALMSDENIQNKELLNLIIRQSERGAALVKQMLDFNRQTIANPKPINLQEFFKEFAKIIRTSLPTSIALTLSLKNSTIFMDSIQLQQILMNIILNAKDALPQGGEISIKIKEVPASKVRDFENIDIPQDKNYIHLIIEDDGEGMEKEVLEKAFEPFFSTKSPGRGSGLGLSQVYGIIRQSNGFIDIESESGRGTRVHLFIPTYDGEVEEACLEKTELGKGKILLVEDEEDVREITKIMLENHGFEVITANNGKRALELYDESFDLVLTDIIMPEMNGNQLIEEIRKKNQNASCIAMTGYSDVEIPEGITILHKPLTSTKLVNHINEEIRKKNSVCDSKD